MSDPKIGKTISAVIACYNDAQAIPIMYDRLVGVFARIGVKCEIIFVNDCSPDNSATVLATLAAKDRRVVVVTHTRNFGSQSAFTSGMRIATGDAVVLLDGDLQDPPELIEEFFKEWQKGYDVVYGRRVQRETTAFMKLAYKAFYRVFRALSYVTVPLDAGDFSLMDRRVVQTLNGLLEKNRLLRGLRAWVGYRQTGVPYVRPERAFGLSTNSFLRNLGWARRAIISFSYFPLDFIMWLSMGIVGFALLAIGGQIIVRIFFPQIVPSGFTTLIVLILFMGGVQLLCLGIIGSYLAHIYDEVKHRPSYVVDSILNDPQEKAQ
jgi:polyisoprenyl-phosphate glycosyltransferase